MNMKKQTLYGTFGVAIITLACTFGGWVGMETPGTPTQSQVDAVGTIVAETMQALTAATAESVPTEVPTQAPTEASEIAVTFEYAVFTIPNGVASGANPEVVPVVGEENGSPWEAAPAHLKFTLTGFQLQDKFHEPRIFVYPADEFAQVHSGAAQQIERVKKALTGFPLLKETLPNVPFFNAGPLIAANIKIIPFQNGSGVRALTQYAQYSAPINNREMFYHFQGLTSDNKYYVIAILPITAPILPEDEKPEAAVPAEGVPVPTDIGPNEVYYISVTQKLNSLAPDSYAPSLNTLDALIQSLLVTTP
jgi:hypothetical protein